MSSRRAKKSENDHFEKHLKDAITHLKGDDEKLTKMNITKSGISAYERGYYVGNEAIKDEGLVALSGSLAKNSHLRSLTLRACDLTDTGVSKLGEVLAMSTGISASLTSLDLCHNKIKGAGMLKLSTYLSSTDGLLTLNLTGNQAGPEGGAAIGTALQNNKSLTELFLGSNGIGDDGFRPLATSLRTNSSLTTLDVTDNSIGEAGAGALVLALPHNGVISSLLIGGNALGGGADDGEGGADPAASSSSSSSSSSGLSRLLQAVTPSPAITTLDLWKTGVGDAAATGCADMLISNTAITRLVLRWNSISGPGAIALGASLGANTTLIYLDLAGNRVGDVGARKLATALASNGTLQRLLLANNSIGDNGASALAEALTRNAPAPPAEEGEAEAEAAVGGCSALLTLDLSGNPIVDAGMSALMDMMFANSTVVNLFISTAGLGGAAAEAVGEALDAFLWEMRVIVAEPN